MCYHDAVSEITRCKLPETVDIRPTPRGFGDLSARWESALNGQHPGRSAGMRQIHKGNPNSVAAMSFFVLVLRGNMSEGR
jgi:hypothetical protein